MTPLYTVCDGCHIERLTDELVEGLCPYCQEAAEQPGWVLAREAKEARMDRAREALEVRRLTMQLRVIGRLVGCDDLTGIEAAVRRMVDERGGRP